MAVRQYIGARYVPIFGRPGEQSIQWDNTGTYEPLTVVLHQGNSYTSRQFVPVGIDITNEDYWAETGNYNAQIEQYRQEVLGFEDDIEDNAAAITALQNQMAATAQSELLNRIVHNDTTNTLQDQQLAGTSSSGLKDAIDENARDITNLGNDISDMEADLTELSDLVSAKEELIWIGDSWSHNFDALLPVSVAQTLGMTLHNYAASGTGWFTGTNTFAVQAQNAIADTNVNPEKVRLIVIYGCTNDFHYGSTSAAAYQSVISSTCTSLKQAFPHAEIHHFFNTCYHHNNTDYYKLNNQINLFKDIAYYIADSKACVAHAESAYWMINPDAFQDDLLHPTQNTTKRLAGRVAKSVTGCAVESNRYLDVKEISLASNDGTITGTMYVTAKDEFVEIATYINVSEDSNATKGIGSGHLIPFNILRNAAIGDVHNHIAVPLGKNSAIGMGILDVQLNVTQSGGDIIYIGQPNGSGIVSAGSYNGYGKFIMFV